MEISKKLKKINLTKNKWTRIDENHFFHATNGIKACQTTLVNLKTDNQFLFIEFECKNDPFVSQNTYLEHNSEMYNQEVFEIFIAPGKNVPLRYLEIEINPNNALFVAWVENPTAEAPNKLEFIDHNNAGIIHGVQKGADFWTGFLTIPLSLLGNVEENYRLNFYRIVSKQSQQNSDWKCNILNCDFTCWSSTKSGDTPRFHRPEAFGILEIN